MSKAVLIFAALAAMTLAPICYVGIIFFDWDPEETGNWISVFMFFAMNICMLSPFLDRKKSGAEKMESTLLIWMWVTGITHLSWELGWCLVHPYLADVGPQDHWAWIWWAYGIADVRYLHSDSFIVPMEWVTSVIGGPINIYVLYLLQKKRRYKANIWIIIVSAMEFYGTVLYFTTEMAVGFRSVDLDGFINLWFKFVGMNTIWLIYPFLSMLLASRDLLKELGEPITIFGR